MKDQKIYTGIWIDTRLARIVKLKGEEVNLLTIESLAELHPREEGQKAVKTKRGMAGMDLESKQERRFAEALKVFYKKILHQIEEADSIYVCGPAGAKIDLSKEMNAYPAFNHKLAGIEACDQITVKQLVAKVKDFFQTTGTKSK